MIFFSLKLSGLFSFFFFLRLCFKSRKNIHFPPLLFRLPTTCQPTEWHTAHNVHSQPPTSIFAEEPRVHIELNHTSRKRPLIILYSLVQKNGGSRGGGGRVSCWQDSWGEWKYHYHGGGWPSYSLALIPSPDKWNDNAVGLRKIGATLGQWVAENVLMTACLGLWVADKTQRYTLCTLNQLWS